MNLGISLSLCRASQRDRNDQRGNCKLRFGIEAAYPPFENKAPTGQLQGFDIDVGYAVCAKMGVKCRWVENSFDGLIPALQARRFGVVNSAMNITATTM